MKNSELLHHFRSRISRTDPAEQQRNRDLFKKLVNAVAVVKQVDGVKFVVAKKRFRDFVKEANGDGAPQTRMEESLCGRHAASPASPPRRPDPGKMLSSDVEDNNNSVSCPLNPEDARCCSPRRASVGSAPGGGGSLPRNDGADVTGVKVLNLSGDQGRKSGAVFAVVAVKSPPRAPSPAAQGGSRGHVGNPPHDPGPVTPAAPVLTSTASRKGAQRDSKCWKEGTPSPPAVQPPSKTPRQGDDGRYSECVPLDPLAHEWLVKCAAGLWGQIYALMLRDATLVHKKDFMSGFTALHWAAKDGSCRAMRKILDVSGKTGARANVDAKAHGGYTPLHIAAMHGRTDAMVLLVQRYGASVGERDNDGKKAFHYLDKGVPDDVRALLGGAPLGGDREKAEDEEDREHPKGFNTLSKLFQPHTGKKHKAAKYVPDWLE